jgi:hypothetical protein
MLSVKTNNPYSLPYYYINQKFDDYRKLIKSNSNEVLELYADGDELDYILNWIIKHNVHIPFVPGMCTWYGDFAKFIFTNMY